MPYTVTRYPLMFSGGTTCYLKKGTVIIDFVIVDGTPLLIIATDYDVGENEERTFLVYPENYNISEDFFIPIGVAKDEYDGIHWCIEVISK